jgi:hypothetical protein
MAIDVITNNAAMILLNENIRKAPFCAADRETGSNENKKGKPET